MQYEIKTEIATEINEGIKPAELTIITIDKNDLKDAEWFYDGDEMVYHNNRFDILKSTENKNSFTFYCINDKKETELFTNLENHIDSNVTADKPNKNESSKKIIDHVIKLFFSKEKSISFIDLTEGSKFNSILLIYKHPLLKTNLPPPKFA